MPHIHCEPGQYDHTVSAFIIRLDNSEPQMLLHMHKKVRKLTQPGGHIELNENVWEAIQHELVEETGYNLRQLKILQPTYRIKTLTKSVVHPQPICVNTHNYGMGLDHKHLDTNYCFVAYGEPEGKPGEGESDDLRWFTREQLKNLNENEVTVRAKEIGEAIFEHFLEEWVEEPLTNFSV